MPDPDVPFNSLIFSLTNASVDPVINGLHVLVRTSYFLPVLNIRDIIYGILFPVTYPL